MLCEAFLGDGGGGGKRGRRPSTHSTGFAIGSSHGEGEPHPMFLPISLDLLLFCTLNNCQQRLSTLKPPPPRPHFNMGVEILKNKFLVCKWAHTFIEEKGHTLLLGCWRLPSVSYKMQAQVLTNVYCTVKDSAPFPMWREKYACYLSNLGWFTFSSLHAFSLISHGIKNSRPS